MASLAVAAATPRASPRPASQPAGCSAAATAQHPCQQAPRCPRQRHRQPGRPQHATSRQHGVSCRSSSNGGGGAEVLEDQSIRVKCMLAEGSGRLDLSDCELVGVPPAAFDIPGLEELSLAGNQLEVLPDDLGRLTSLSRLQLAGNRLAALPPALCRLQALRGLWLHGNLLEGLPRELGALGALTQLSLSGNRLAVLPDGLSSLAALQELSCSGNRLQALPAGIGGLTSLKKLSLHGNQLGEVPPRVGGLSALEELSLQGNPRLAFLPDSLGALPALRDLAAADCSLAAVPSSLRAAPALQSLSLYGNQLQQFPAAVLQAPALRTLWLEGNPLTPEAVSDLLAALPSSGLSALGLDEAQLAGAPPALLDAALASGKLRVSAAAPGGGGHGYFKLERAPPPSAAAAALSNGNHSIAAAGPSGASAGAAEVLVVSFGSAPGTPNWGGLLRKVREAADTPAEQDFDVLYVVDPHRSWYGGGGEGYAHYERRLAAVCERYRHVIFIGDSMGATGALLFAHLATEVHAWTPQVDLATSSIRPGEDAGWHATLKRRVLENVAACAGTVVVHTGSWRHDLDQARCLPSQEGIKMQIYSVESHRLAMALDRRGMLVQIVRSAVLQAMGLTNKDSLRLANLF